MECHCRSWRYGGSKRGTGDTQTRVIGPSPDTRWIYSLRTGMHQAGQRHGQRPLAVPPWPVDVSGCRDGTVTPWRCRAGNNQREGG